MPSSSVPPLLPEHESVVSLKSKPWGAWATAGLGLGLLIVMFIVQTVCAVIYAVFEMFVLHHSVKGDEIEKNGLFLAIATIAAMPVVIATACVFVKMRRGWSAAEYLALKPCRLKTLLFWCAVTLGYAALSEGILRLFGVPTPQFMIEVYESARTSRVLPLLWLAVIVVAPVSEEFLMRGFLFKGWLHSPLGGIGTVVLTAVTWAATHFQYDFFTAASVFGAGLVLGLARWKTGSIVPCMIMHGLWNLISTVVLHTELKY